MAQPRAAIDFDEFHRTTLPAWLDRGRQTLAAQAAAGLSSLALRMPDGAAFTYRPRIDGIDILPGDDAAQTVVELSAEAWQGLVQEFEAPAGLLYAGRVQCRRGAIIDLMNWESALRALYNGRPPYDPTRLALSDRLGNALDPQTTFRFGAEPADTTHFLETAGYLFVREVFSAAEIAALLDESEQLQREARPGDKLSWWGKTASGDEALCRVTRGSSKPRLASLPSDARIQSLKALANQSFVHKRGEGEGVTVIFKRPGMTEGLGDLPWHRDCGMGGHATMCPILLMSIFLTAATPESGELAMLPGSHRASFNAHDRRHDPARYAAHFRAQPGDVSLHYSDTVHAAPPPTDPHRSEYRVSAVLSFAAATAHHHRGERSYNDVLHQRDDGQIEHLESVAKRL